MHHRHACRCWWGYQRSRRRRTRCRSGCCNRRDPSLRARSMLCLRGRSGRRALTQLAARGLSRPGTRIDLTHDAEPFFGLGKRREVTHVQTKALTPFLEAAAHEEMKTPQLGQIGLRERHRRRRGAQVEHKRPRAERRHRLLRGFRDCTGSEVGRCCHNFPGPKHSTPRSLGTARILSTGMEVLSFARLCARMAAPPS